MPSADFQTLPVFKRGAKVRSRLFVFVTACLAMLVADIHFRYLEALRQVLSVVTYPLQRISSEPVMAARDASIYFATLAKVQLENADLRRRQLDLAERRLRFEQLEQENAQLRALLDMAKRVRTRSVAAEVLYNAPDPFSRKVILDHGARGGVETGQAVIDADGVLGQVTRVYPIQSEVTLVTDRNQAVPVQIERNGLRGVVFGTGRGGLELRFVLANADIQAGDRLVTSGLDGLFVPGLPVAVVESVERDTDAFARVTCRPLGGVERSIRVLVLGRAELPPPPPKPDSEVSLAAPNGTGSGKSGAKTGKSGTGTRRTGTRGTGTRGAETRGTEGGQK
ncbi:MAG: rod shape-determining protein MreC [Azoarcus sp.]|jgi:rod shape-determining protein MreC|nr:rod shape-determining protein MreC [Azoarcus sp.]